MAMHDTIQGITVEMVVMYKECCHNHAAQMMGNAFDGCGLFEAGGPNGTPEAMVCAACLCHRNFHRRVEVELPPTHRSRQHTSIPTPQPQPQAYQQPFTSQEPRSDPSLGIPGPQVHQQTSATHTPTAETRPEFQNPPPHSPSHQQRFTNNAPRSQAQGAGTCTSLVLYSPFQFTELPIHQATPANTTETGTRRRRTRITRAQITQLRAIAKRNNWKPYRDHSSEEIARICSEVGITTRVMRSWIYNNNPKRATANASTS